MVFILSIIKDLKANPYFQYDQGMANPITGVVNFLRDVNFETFTPMTHYKDDDFRVTATPMYSKITTLFKDPGAPEKVEGDNLDGKAVGIAFNYAISRHLSFVTLFSGVIMKGGAVEALQTPDGNGKSYLIDMDNRSYSLHAGLGYDFIAGDNWSLPIVIGPYFQQYDVSMRYRSTWYNDPYPSMKIQGKGYMYGLFLCAAVSRKAEVLGHNFKISPYLMFYSDYLNNPKVDITVVESNYSKVPAGTQGDIELKKLKCRADLLPGFKLEYISKSSISLSVSVSGVLSRYMSFYNDKFLYGVDSANYMVSVTYNGNLTSKTEK